MADTIPWDTKTLRLYKLSPWVNRQGKPIEPQLEGKRKVVVTLNLEISEFTETRQNLLKFGLAKFLEISTSQVNITEIESGSVKCTVTLPASKAQQLLDAFAADPENLSSFLQSLELVTVSEPGPCGSKQERDRESKHVSRAIQSADAEDEHSSEPTDWSLVATATMNDDRKGRDALTELYRRYRGTVMNFFYSRVPSHEDAEDLTQSLFTQMFSQLTWLRTNPERGRFRNFMFSLAANTYRNWVSSTAAAKRGGAAPLSLDLLECGWEPTASGDDSALKFDREWAASTMNAAWRIVERDSASDPVRAARFAVLRRFLPGSEAPPTYTEAADALGMPADNVRQLVARLRKSFRTAVRAQVADTLLSQEDLDDELNYLSKFMLSS